MQCFSRVSALRRERNSHNAAKPRTANAGKRTSIECRRRQTQDLVFVQESRRRCCHRSRGPEQQRHGAALPHQGAQLRRKRRASVSSSGRRSQRQFAQVGHLLRRLERVARQRYLRGAGRDCCVPPEATGAGQRSAGAALPNPSLKRRLSTAGRLARATALVHHRPHGQGRLPRPAA